jgi:GAF domain-containing protein
MSESGLPSIEMLSRENERLRDQQQALSDVLRAVARSEGLDVVFDAVVEAAARLCQAEHGQVHIRAGEIFRLAGDYGSQPEILAYERSHPHVPDRTSVVGRVALSRAVEHIPDVLADPDYSYPTSRVGGFRSLLGVPIFVEDDLIGVIDLVRNEPKAFSEEEIGIVRTFADQAAIAIVNARLLAGHRAYITCLFCDLRDFTSFAETAAPEELLVEYHAMVGELVSRYDAKRTASSW